MRWSFAHASRSAVSAWLASPSVELVFHDAGTAIGDEELATLVQGTLGLPTRPELEVLTKPGGDTRLLYVVPDEATTRLAELPEASLSTAAGYLLDIEEADLPVQARSGPKTRSERVAG